MAGATAKIHKHVEDALRLQQKYAAKYNANGGSQATAEPSTSSINQAETWQGAADSVAPSPTPPRSESTDHAPTDSTTTFPQAAQADSTAPAVTEPTPAQNAEQAQENPVRAPSPTTEPPVGGSEGVSASDPQPSAESALPRDVRRQQLDQEHEEKVKAFEAAELAFEQKKLAMVVSSEDQTDFMKLERLERDRVREYMADRQRSEEARLAEEEKPARGKAPQKHAANEDLSDEQAPPKRAKRGRAKKSEQAAGPKRSGGGQSNAGKSTKQTKPRPASKKQKEIAHQMTNINSLYGTNVFEETERTADLPGQRTFTDTRNRVDALKQMLSTVAHEDEKGARADKSFLEDSLKIFGTDGSVRAGPGGTWVINGMKTGLKSYQALGCSFLRKRELSEDQPRGGILADEMGLGKTVMMLGNIVNGLSRSRREKQPTLIVASRALCQQWDQEIRKHCNSRREQKNGVGTVRNYYAKGNGLEIEDLEKADIVITTYHEVMASYPQLDPPEELTTAQSKDNWWRRYYEENRGDLHKVHFHRVVIDEAHAIKNHKSRTSMACRALLSTFRWAITGTPIQNRLDEFYPYFKFLQVPNTGSMRTFKSNYITDDSPDGTIRLNAVLNAIMVRRTHADKFMNARLLELPQPHQKTWTLEFSTLERQIYEVVKSRFIKRINTMSRGNALDNKSIYTLILRMRQMTSHILLVEDTMMKILEREDFEKLEDLCTNDEQNGTVSDGGRLLLVLRNLLRQKAHLNKVEGGHGSGVLNEEEISPTDVTELGLDDSNVGGQHGKSFRFKHYLTKAKASPQFDDVNARSKCISCRQDPLSPHITSCCHIYCFSCLEDLRHSACRRGLDQAKCKECGDEFHSSRPLDMSAVSDSNEEAGTNKDANTIDFRKETWLTMKGPVYPSAKTLAVKAQILEWFESHPGEKVIIFTQFRGVIEVLQRICRTEGWGCCQYHGKMSHGTRANTLEDFESNKNKRVLLASLQAGGLGLNLTMASLCINMDPWWNSAVEQQAFCRIFRIGQERETHMTRLAVSNTIDTAMMQIKERKDREIASVMERGQYEKLPPAQLMEFFGHVRNDPDGRPFIIPVEEEGHDHPGLRLGADDRTDEYGYLGNEL